LRVKKPGDFGDVGCGLGFSVDVFGTAAIALFFGQACALSVMDVAHLGLEKAAGGAILVEGGAGRSGHTDEGDIASFNGRGLGARPAFALSRLFWFGCGVGHCDCLLGFSFPG